MRERFDDNFMNWNSGTSLKASRDLIVDFIEQEVAAAVAQERKSIIELLESCKLPQNGVHDGTTTLMYIPNESNNIEINNRLNWIIASITKKEL